MNITVNITNTDTNEKFRVDNFASRDAAQDYCDHYNKSEHAHFAASIYEPRESTPFQRVAEMNTAFGNPKGDAQNIDWPKILNQCKNLFDEYCELLIGLGMPAEKLMELRSAHQKYVVGLNFDNEPDVEAVRDALCDIQVFDLGAQHLMGYDGDNDMDDVVDGVMTRFIKSPEDRCRTMELHHAKGVTQVYFEGEYPKVVMKSAVDQPDAPKGKFLKSASYVNTVFRSAP